MTAESYFLLDISDIRRVCFRCKKCGSTLHVSPERWDHLPYRCANCGEEWFKAGSLQEKFLQQLSELLEMLRKAADEPFSIHFQVGNPPDKKP